MHVGPESIAIQPAVAQPARWKRLAAPVRSFFAHPAVALTLITLAGAGLRFWKLTQPALWGDEIATFRRVCGSYQDLVDQLAAGGFTPLHYLLYFWIQQHHPLTPFLMRLPVAIAGTLMIPAMYFLARQLVSRPVALLSAAFTAGSAYMLNFSRDAKMYADLWLLITLHMGCFFWWLRARNRIAWCCWVLAGTTMLGIQLVSASVLPIELLIVLTAPNPRWKNLWQLVQFGLWMPLALLLAIAGGGWSMIGKIKKTRWSDPRPVTVHARNLFRWFARSFCDFQWPPLIGFAVGVALLGAAPYTYYAKFDKYFDRVYDESNNRLDWWHTGIGWVEGYNAGRDGGDLIRYTATAFSFAWEWPRDNQVASIAERSLKLLKGSAAVLAVIAVLGALPWTLRGPTPRARVCLWLSFWIALPLYGFYCASMKDSAAPIDWLRSLRSWEHLRAASLIAGIWVAWWLIVSRRRWGQALRFIVIVVCLIGLCVAIHRAVPQPLPRSVWVPRYLGFVWPAFAIVAATLLWRVPTRPLRWSAILIVLSINLSIHGSRVLAGSEGPNELMARDVVNSQPPNTSRLFSKIHTSPGAEPGTGMLESEPGRYYLSVMSGKPIIPADLRAPGYEKQFFIGKTFLLQPLRNAVLGVIQQNPKIDQIIVWDELAVGRIDQDDTLLSALPLGWTRSCESTFAVRDHWTWEDYITLRRRVYQRK